MGFRNIQECLHQTEQNPSSNEAMASCVFANYLAMVLMHLPTDKLPPLRDFLPYLPAGLRAYGIYVLAHNAYLHEEYANALGLCQSVFLMLDGCYPIAMEYLYCVIIMSLVNQKKENEARDVLMTAWNMAKADGFLEPFIEHHGLMLGQIEACIKPTEPELYKQLSQAVIAFSRGWMNIHNPKLQASVTDKLTPSVKEDVSDIIMNLKSLARQQGLVQPGDCRSPVHVNQYDQTLHLFYSPYTWSKKS